MKAIPQAVQDKLNNLMDVDETVRVFALADIGFNGKFGSVWLFGTNTHFISYNSNVGVEPDIIRIPLSKIVKIEIHDLVGNGHVKISNRYNRNYCRSFL